MRTSYEQAGVASGNPSHTYLSLAVELLVVARRAVPCEAGQ